MANSVEPGSVSMSDPSRATGLQRFGYAMASIPFVLIVVAQFIAPGFMEPIFANPPETLGLPAGIVALFVVAIWAALAFVVIRTVPTGLGIAAGLLLFTVPSIVRDPLHTGDDPHRPEPEHVSAMATTTQPSATTKAPSQPATATKSASPPEPVRRESWAKRNRRQNLELIRHLPLGAPEKRLLEYRWLDEVDWTEREATRSLRFHHLLRVIAIVGGVAVSGLVGAGAVLQPSTNALSLAAFVTSLVVTGAIALDEYFRFGEKHRHLRLVTELLRSEGALFFALTGPYAKSKAHAAAYPVFVERVERIARKDVQDWVTDVIGTAPAPPTEEPKIRSGSPSPKR